jgi:prophage regulatory protein
VPPDLIGFGELADILGVSRATAGRYATRPDFPAPVGELASGRVWRKSDVERWAKKNPPRPPGRPPKH